MAPHPRFTRIARLTVAALASLVVGSAALASDEPPSRPGFDTPLEVLDDPPGEPARPVTGAPLATPHVYRGFTSVQVNTDAGVNIPGDAANEPSIAVDPTNPLRLAIGWRQFDTVSSNFRQAGYAYSNDGGRTWTFPGVLEPGVFRSDPVLAFAADGTLYYNSLTSDFTTDVWTSTDAGESYPTSVDAGGGDKQWMAVDRSGGPGNGNIYQAWSNAAGCCGNRTWNRSADEAGSFSNPVELTGRPRWGTMSVGPDGTLYMIGTTNGDEFRFIKSTDAENGGSSPTFQYVVLDLGGSMVIYGDPNPEGLGGQLYIDIDPSDGPHGGTLYALGAVDPPGSDPEDVHFVKSTDGGTTWSSPLRLNDDPPGNYNWFGTMAVAPNGRIDVVWLDTRVSVATNVSALYFTQSTDGGVTWSPNEQLSGTFDSWAGWPQQNKMGDYFDMKADLVGSDLAWTATFNSEQDVYYLRIGDYDCNGNGVGDSIDIGIGGSPDLNGNGIPDECEDGIVAAEELIPNVGSFLMGNVPNPVTGSTTIRFAVPTGASHIRLSVFDVDGRHVRTLLDDARAPGVNAVNWDGNDADGNPVASGVFFYRLQSDDIVETRRMLVVR